MKLDEVTSIMQIWEEAKRNGEKFSSKDGRSHEYRFESGEFITFDLVVSTFIEDDPAYKDYYEANFDLIINDIKEKHSKKETYRFLNPFHKHN